MPGRRPSASRIKLRPRRLLLAMGRRQFGLTFREADVLLWIANGKTNREIGQILEMSPRTVNKHLEPVFRKQRVENRTPAAAAAIKCLGRLWPNSGMPGSKSPRYAKLGVT